MAGMSSLLVIGESCLIKSGLSRSSLLLLQFIWTPSPLQVFEKNRILGLSGCSISLLVRKKSHIFLNSMLTRFTSDSTLSEDASSVVSSANNSANNLEDIGRSLM